MAGVFISYRKSDSAGFTGRLFDHLSRHFGPEQVFMDVDDIARGADYPQVIEGAVGQASAMVVVIGRQWLACTDARGNRRLDDPADWVRNEVAAGLRREILVLPVLVDGATMPAADQLPPDIARLAFKQAGEISNSRWEYDLGQVTQSLERVVTPAAGTTPNRTTKRLGTALVGAALAGTVVMGLLYALAPEPNPRPGLVAAPPAASAAAPASSSSTSSTAGTTGTGSDPAPGSAPETPAAPARDPADLTGEWRDDDGELYRVVKGSGDQLEMGRIDPPESDGVYRIMRVNGRDVEISIGVLPSGTQQGMATLRRSIDGNVMSGLLRSTQIEDEPPTNWVLRRVPGPAQP